VIALPKGYEVGDMVNYHVENDVQTIVLQKAGNPAGNVTFLSKPVIQAQKQVMATTILKSIAAPKAVSIAAKPAVVVKSIVQTMAAPKPAVKAVTPVKPIALPSVVVTAKRTYWWVAVLAVVAFGAYYLLFTRAGRRLI
jgi:hypothetical protein